MYGAGAVSSYKNISTGSKFSPCSRPVRLDQSQGFTISSSLATPSEGNHPPNPSHYLGELAADSLSPWLNTVLIMVSYGAAREERKI